MVERKRKPRTKRKSVARKTKPRAKATSRPGYDIHTGKPTGRDASAMQRLEKLTEKYVGEGMSLAEARAKARAVVEISFSFSTVMGTLFALTKIATARLKDVGPSY